MSGDLVHLWKLPGDVSPRYVSVDRGSEGMVAECEFQVLPDGAIEVLDFRQYPDESEVVQ